MKEQLIESEGASSTTATADASAHAETHGIPLHVYNQASHVRPGDVEGLALLLQAHPDLQQQILEVASHHAGMSTVKQAIALRQGGSAGIGAADQAEIREIAGDESYKPPGKAAPGGAAGIATKDQQEIRQIAGDETYAAPGESAAVPATKATAEPAWVAGARRFNEAHPTLTDEFNDLTSFLCSTDGTQLDPQEVARWQRTHGVAADGKVGAHTVAAARVQSTKDRTAIAAKAPASDDRPPV